MSRVQVIAPTTPFPFPSGSQGAGLFLHKTGFTAPLVYDGTITLDQISHIFKDVQQPNSSTGQLSINVPDFLALQQQPFGYFNMSIDNLGWVAQNIRIDANGGVTLLSTPVVIRSVEVPNDPIVNESVKIQFTTVPVSYINQGRPCILLPGPPGHRQCARRWASYHKSASAPGEGPRVRAAG